MKILYVKRQIVDTIWKKIPKKIRQWYCFWGREGFFRASLHYHNEVTEIFLKHLENKSQSWINKFDLIIFNFRANHAPHKDSYGFNTLWDWVEEFKNKIQNKPVVLLDVNASAGKTGNNDLLDNFDLVFKREIFRANIKYNSLKPTNRAKLRTTMLSCHFVSASRFNFKEINIEEEGFRSPAEEFEHDVFFVGKDTSQERRALVDRLLDSEYDFYGGLQEKKEKLPERLKTKRLGKKEYIKTIRNSKINLAPEGLGEFTYRHLEIWWACAFMLCSPSINELELPLDVEDGVHYVTYESEDDLLDKIDYYLKHPQQRKQIAQNGRKAFEDGYDFEKHGEYITGALKSIVYP